MSLETVLRMLRMEYDVCSCNFALQTTFDENGMPSTAVAGCKINIEVKSTYDTSIIEAMLNKEGPFDGKIAFINEDGTRKKLYFTGYIVYYKERFDARESMTINFTISAQELKFENDD